MHRNEILDKTLDRTLMQSLFFPVDYRSRMRSMGVFDVSRQLLRNWKKKLTLQRRRKMKKAEKLPLPGWIYCSVLN